MEEFIKKVRENHKLNSFVVCTLLNDVKKETKEIILNKSYVSPHVTNGLHMMNATYLYTNPPPYGYGTPSPYVGATVNRAYEYVQKFKKDASMILEGYEIIDAAWHTIENYPPEGTIGCFHPTTVECYTKRFLQKFKDPIIEVATDVINWMKVSNADVLSKGRQTWDPEIKKSTPCAKAFKDFLGLLKRNLDQTPTTLIEAFIYWYKMYGLKELRVKSHKIELKKVYKYYPMLQQKVLITRVKRKIIMKRILGLDDCNRWLNDYARSFCSYIKHAERGKKDRRAIASGSIVLRMHLKVVEEFHLKLSKLIPGSTISIGGEEKKRKIISELEQTSINAVESTPIIMQGTEDATKWNECLNPQLFALVHKTLFSQDIRNELLLPSVTEDEEIFEKICRMTFFYMLIKRIHLGQGFLLQNDIFYTRQKWCDTKVEQLNSYNQKWFSEIKDKLDDEDYVRASPGFLMGMLNACSTIIGLIPTLGLEIPGTSIKCLRSSDDSMTLFCSNTIDGLERLIRFTYSLYRLFGINPSQEKSILFPHGFGEYTSWYQDKKFVGQCGVETSSMKPGGQNPQDDFNNAASLTLNLMRTNLINLFGATIRLPICLKNVRNLWNVKPNRFYETDKVPSKDVIFLSDGGNNCWSIENLAVDEATIRFNKIANEIDENYFYRIMNPSNPFSSTPEEELLFSRDTGTLMYGISETCRNVFTFIKKGNRTHKNNESKAEFDVEKDNQMAHEISVTIDPSLLLSIPSSKSNLADSLIANLLVFSSSFKLDDHNTKLVMDAIEKLEGLEQSSDNDQETSEDSD